MEPFSLHYPSSHIVGAMTFPAAACTFDRATQLSSKRMTLLP